MFTLSSDAFGPEMPMPRLFTRDGRNVSPPLAWSEPPAGTRSFALVCDAPDHPDGDWVHWVIHGMSVGLLCLRQGLPAAKVLPGGLCQGVNDFGEIGYTGPERDLGRRQRIFFTLYALDCELPGERCLTAGELEQATAGHILGEAQIFCVY